MLDMNQLGSIASIIALMVMVIGGMYRLAKRYRETLKKENIEAKEFADWLSSIVDESSTAASRSDAAAFIQHIMDSYRHLIVTSYLSLLIYLTIGFGSFLLFKTISIDNVAWLFLCWGIGVAFSELWFMLWAKKRLRKADDQVGEAWAKQLDKMRARKRD